MLVLCFHFLYDLQKKARLSINSFLIKELYKSKKKANNLYSYLAVLKIIIGYNKGELLLKKTKTYFASAERLDRDEVYSQTVKILGLKKVISVLNTIPNMVAILNKERQVVFANKAFTEMIGLKNFEEGLGKRPGELFKCIYAHDTKYGCGTAKNCRYCGAILTVLKCQETKQKQEGDALVTVFGKNKEHIPLHLNVLADTLNVDDQDFYIVIMTLKNSQ